MLCLVSMHLLVLSAFRQKGRKPEGKGTQSLNAPWCSVLSDGKSSNKRRYFNVSQCTFWCSVLSDAPVSVAMLGLGLAVSMHLLVLSAFRLEEEDVNA